MPNLTTLTLSSGAIQNSGTISTLDNSFGTAGTSNANILSVQGASGGNPITTAVTGTITIVSSQAPTVGQAVMAASIPVVMASDQTPVSVREGTNYTFVGASSSAVALHGSVSGASGDWLGGILVIPSSVSPGSVSLIDGSSTTAIFVGGTTSLTNLVSFFIPVGAKSTASAWKVTTGANLSVLGVGNFT